MKRMTKRVFCLLLAFCLATLVSVPVVSAKQEGPWEYYVAEGQAHITGYNASVQGHLDIPETLEGVPVYAIREEAFMGCHGLTSVTIPSSVVWIDSWAFSETGLTTVTISKSVIAVGVCAFSDCLSLTEIIVEEDNPNYTSIDGVLFTNDLTALMQYPGGKKDEYYEIPKGVDSLNRNSFSGNSYLKEVVISDTVTVVGGLSFVGCVNLVDVTIPSSVEKIWETPFGGAYDPEKLDWPLVPGFTVHGYAGSQADIYTWIENLPFHPINKLGDTNYDEKVNAKDALVTLRISVGSIYFTPAMEQSSDVNGDTVVNAKDALEILKKAVGKPACF